MVKPLDAPPSVSLTLPYYLTPGVCDCNVHMDIDGLGVCDAITVNHH